MPQTASRHDSGATFTTRCDSTTANDIKKVPGLIILNPGALLWSNKEKYTMTVNTWLARKHLHALGEDYVIDSMHNHIEGHATPYEHIETCMDTILPQILAEDAQLYIVGITTSAEYFINWYQARQCTEGTPHTNHCDVPGIVKKLSAMAFMQPTHDAAKVKCDTVEMMLHDFGRQWIKSTKPLGTFLNSVKPTEPPALPSFPAPLHARAEDDVLRLPDYDSAHPEAGTALTSYAGIEMASKRLSYDHCREIVSCATYSGATDIDEMIWPNAMDLALGHFNFVAEKTARPWAL